MSFRSVISGANVETAAAANCRRRSGPPVALDVAQSHFWLISWTQISRVSGGTRFSDTNK
ncbi:hypothetical protein LINPERHAP2_LOCUS17258 [Linum perenne]